MFESQEVKDAYAMMSDDPHACIPMFEKVFQTNDNRYYLELHGKVHGGPRIAVYYEDIDTLITKLKAAKSHLDQARQVQEGNGQELFK